MLARSHSERGMLASWQLRRATEMMMSGLSGDIALSDVAAGCGLSLSYFTRAFKQSTGDPPHRWLLRQRIERAKELLRDPQVTLAEVAVACGFADQSHFTRVFNASAGASPGVWRRNAMS
jgi:AraC family transcriptional regulator